MPQELVVSQHMGTQPWPGKEAVTSSQNHTSSRILLPFLLPLPPQPSPLSSSLAGQFLQGLGNPQVEGKS